MDGILLDSIRNTNLDGSFDSVFLFDCFFRCLFLSNFVKLLLKPIIPDDVPMSFSVFIELFDKIVLCTDQSLQRANKDTQPLGSGDRDIHSFLAFQEANELAFVASGGSDNDNLSLSSLEGIDSPDKKFTGGIPDPFFVQSSHN